MADQIPDFVDGDTNLANRVTASWLNDVNKLRYQSGDATRGAALLAMVQSGTGAVARSVQDKAREVYTSEDNPTIGAGNTAVGVNALRAVTTSDENTAFGFHALTAITSTNGTTGRHNVGFGSYALEANTSGTQNCAIGNAALQNNLTADSNVAIGNGALTDLTGGAGGNVSVGIDSCRLVTTATENVAIGTTALSADLTGSANTAVGHAALQNALGTSNVALGSRAGRYETGSNAFYIDNQDRTNSAGDKAKALMYGTFDATAANQRLQQNAVVTKPVHPAFLAFATTTANVTGDATSVTVIWGSEAYDQHSDFAANTFTAPVTGRYHFDVGVNSTGIAAGNTVYLVTLVCTSRSIGIANLNPGPIQQGGTVLIGRGTDVDMTAGDTATVTFRVDGGTKIVGYNSGSSFSGHLVC